MLSSIHPLGERARGNRWGITASAYLLGSVGGGVVAGVVCAALGHAVSLLGRPDQITLAALVAGSGLLAAGLDLGVLTLPLPTVRRQVDEDWLNRYRGWVYGAGFGLQLGLGVVTIVTTAAVYLTFGLSLLAGLASVRADTAVLAGTAVGGAFGLGRALPVLVLRSITTAQLRATHKTLGKTARLARRATVGGMAGVACVGAAACGWLLQ